MRTAHSWLTCSHCLPCKTKVKTLWNYIAEKTLREKIGFKMDVCHTKVQNSYISFFNNVHTYIPVYMHFKAYILTRFKKAEQLTKNNCFLTNMDQKKCSLLYTWCYSFDLKVITSCVMKFWDWHIHLCTLIYKLCTFQPLSLSGHKLPRKHQHIHILWWWALALRWIPFLTLFLGQILQWHDITIAFTVALPWGVFY